MLVVFALVGGLVWVGLRGEAAPATFAAGVVISAVVAVALRLPLGGRASATRVARGSILATRIIARFTVDLAVANVRQLKLILSPRLRPRPRWITYTSRLDHPVSRVLLGVMISLTPGTLSVDIVDDHLYVHWINIVSDDPVKETEIIIQHFEPLLERVFE